MSQNWTECTAKRIPEIEGAPLQEFQRIRCYINWEVEKWKLYSRLYEWRCTRYTWLYKPLSIFNVSTYIFSADITPYDEPKLCRISKVKMLFQFLVLVFSFEFFEFSAAILELDLFVTAVKTTNQTTRWKKGEKITSLLFLFKTATRRRKLQILGPEIGL